MLMQCTNELERTSGSLARGRQNQILATALVPESVGRFQLDTNVVRACEPTQLYIDCRIHNKLKRMFKRDSIVICHRSMFVLLCVVQPT